MFCLVEEIIYLKELKSLCLRKAKVFFSHSDIHREDSEKEGLPKMRRGHRFTGSGRGLLAPKTVLRKFERTSASAEMSREGSSPNGSLCSLSIWNENWKCEKKNRITRSFVVNFLERSDRDFRILSVWCKCGCLSYGLYKLVPEEKIGWDLLRKLFATKVISFSFSGKQLWARSATSFYPKFQHNFPVKIPKRW